MTKTYHVAYDVPISSVTKLDQWSVFAEGKGLDVSPQVEFNYQAHKDDPDSIYVGIYRGKMPEGFAEKAWNEARIIAVEVPMDIVDAATPTRREAVWSVNHDVEAPKGSLEGWDSYVKINEALYPITLHNV